MALDIFSLYANHASGGPLSILNIRFILFSGDGCLSLGLFGSLSCLLGSPSRLGSFRKVVEILSVYIFSLFLRWIWTFDVK
jgi:hypothetical protein